MERVRSTDVASSWAIGYPSSSCTEPGEDPVSHLVARDGRDSPPRSQQVLHQGSTTRLATQPIDHALGPVTEHVTDDLLSLIRI
jgi:hypothetical protein